MSNFKERFAELNTNQKKAVETIDGPLMVLAGPGSGKTELLSLRVAYILNKVDISPANILCLTYTDAAAFNMRERLVGLIGREAYRVAIYTFHSFGVEIINSYPEYFYNGASFVAADDITQTEILEDIFSKLDYDNPLRSEHQDKFVYLTPIKKSIEHLKKAGLTPSDFKTILTENRKVFKHSDPIIQSLFNDRVSKKIIPNVKQSALSIKKYKSKTLPGFFKSFTESLAESMIEAVSAAEAQDASAPLSEWKSNWTSKDDNKLTHLSDALNADKMDALADIYDSYVTCMHEEGYYDYNDMILDTISVLNKNPGVRLDLQERYQYILVDEFQDTNNAQMQLLKLLTDNPVHEGRPNIMVVGDDDQAIYKFQGAEISNISDFLLKSHRDPGLIVLKENYRSTQDVLNIARHIIKKGTSRLENILGDIEKELVAANKKIPKGAIVSKEFISSAMELHWVVSEVKRLIGSGIKPNHIAVIGRKHENLEAIVPYFHYNKVPISYERQKNVLHEPLILQLVTMAQFTDSIMRKSTDADDLLPEILSYPFWGIPYVEVWQLSIRAYKHKKSWLETMQEVGGQFRDIANFFIELGAKATYATAEEVIHELIGGPQQLLPDDDGEIEHRTDMFSPFRSFYFSKERFKNHPASYLEFLSSLQSFVGALREYNRGKPVMIKGMLEFVGMHSKNNLPINNTSAFVNADQAVQLMTAHKAKGLEFDAVFVINCQEKIWASPHGGKNISLPKNLPIGPSRDNIDDQLRLFYVALTRARSFLYLTSYGIETSGKDSVRLGFLAPTESTTDIFKTEKVQLKDFSESAEDLIIEQWQSKHSSPFSPDDKALLSPLLERYQLSVTHLKNFLNVAQAGPLTFFEKNLLRFPEPKNASGAFGSAIHKTIQRIYNYLKNHEKLPTINKVSEWFEELLTDERLNKEDFNLWLKQGLKSLQSFYLAKAATFAIEDRIEFDFSNQGVDINGAALTGKIDKISTIGTKMNVHDFKTGKLIRSWSPSDPYEKIKAWQYRQQLVFYKLLIENSREFSGKYIVERGFIDFVEPSHGKILDLELDIPKEEVERMKKLIKVVFTKIKQLDFPDISSYSKDFKGIVDFEKNLLEEL